MITWFYLFVAIAAEVIATSTLNATQSFTRLWPSLVVVCGYGTAIFFLTLTLKTLPVGIAYAVWSGVGVAAVAVIGWFFLNQKLDLAAILGICLIVAGVLIIHLFSRQAP